MGFKIGLEAELHENTASWATPTFAEMDNVQEITTTIDAAEAEFKHRNLTWAEYERGILQAGVDITVLYDGSDADFQTLRDAFLNKTDLELFVADGDPTVSGTQGLRAEFRVMSMERSEPLEEGLGVTFNVRPAKAATNKPEWHQVA